MLDSHLGRTGPAKTAQLKPGNPDAEAMTPLDLALQPLKKRALNLQHPTAPLTGEMHMILVGPSLIIMARPVHMHEVEFIDNAQFLQRLQGAVNCCQVQPRHSFLGASQNLRRVEMLTSLLENLGDYSPLPGEAEAMLPELGSNGAPMLEMCCEHHTSCELFANKIIPN